MSSGAGGRRKPSYEALAQLDAITRRLREECPWDREQNERTIVPHTVEEAYELADAANRGDDSKLLDELGDVLFQVHFLSLLLEERGAGDLAEVAEHVTDKLIRRHPHVFGDVDASTAPRGPAQLGQDQAAASPAASRASSARFPRTCPSPLYARKVQRRAASDRLRLPRGRGPAAGRARGAGRAGGRRTPEQRFQELGDLLFSVINVARKLHVDPELALRSSADRFRGRVQCGERSGRIPGPKLERSRPDEQIIYYARLA